MGERHGDAGVRRIIRQHLRKAVIVTLKSGDSFSGVLFDADPDVWVLRNATVIPAGTDDRTPADGEVLIVRSDVAFAQFV